MKLTPPQQRAYNALLKDPDGKIASGEDHRVTRPTIEALARKGLVELERTHRERTRRHRNGTTSRYVTVAWIATLVPEHPSSEELEELDLVIANGEGILRRTQREHAAAYVAHTAPTVALEGSPARSDTYSVCRAYRDALERPVSWLLDQVAMLRHLTGQKPLPGGAIPGQANGERTDVWVLTAKTDGPRPGKELGRVRASTQNGAALLGNSLLNTRGGYQMRRLGSNEVGPWLEDFRASGMVLRMETVKHGFRVSQVADDLTLVVRTTAKEAKRDALADLTALYSALGPHADPIHAD
jgi:hypothetical protein